MRASSPGRDRRAAILAAAADLVRERGAADAVSVAEIAARAGTTKATLYRHFKSKAEIGQALVALGLDASAFRVEERRRQILEAALRAFARWGFRGATMARIGQEAGISAGAIYWYYPSKDELISALFDAYSALPHLRQLAALPTGDEETQLRAAADAMLRVIEERVDMFKMVIGEGLAHPDMAQRFYRDSISKVWAEFTRYLDHRVAAGVFRPGDPLARAQAFAGLFIFYALARRSFGEQFPLPREVALREFVDIFLYGVSRPIGSQPDQHPRGDAHDPISQPRDP